MHSLNFTILIIELTSTTVVVAYCGRTAALAWRKVQVEIQHKFNGRDDTFSCQFSIDLLRDSLLKTVWGRILAT